MKRCQAINAKGTPCGVSALRGEDFCLFHSQSENAKIYRARAKNITLAISRRELMNQLTKDYRELAGKSDEKSLAARLRLAPLLHELINERTQLNRLHRLAKEKGLI